MDNGIHGITWCKMEFVEIFIIRGGNVVWRLSSYVVRRLNILKSVFNDTL